MPHARNKNETDANTDHAHGGHVYDAMLPHWQQTTDLCSVATYATIREPMFGRQFARAGQHTQVWQTCTTPHVHTTEALTQTGNIKLHRTADVLPNVQGHCLFVWQRIQPIDS